MSVIWIVNICLAFVLCIFFALTVIPRLLSIAIRYQIFDEPDERKIHKRQVPRLGGMAFMPVIFASLTVLLAFNLITEHYELGVAISMEARQLACAFCAIALSYFVGIIDDLVGVRYKWKFAVQILCGLFLVGGGIVITDLYGLFFIHSIPQWLSVPLTVFVIVFVINAINLIDGIDGLAAGLCTLAFLCYGTSFLYYGKSFDALLSFASVGSILPFFYFNVFGSAEKGKKIFMGDTGSMTLGVVLCIESIRLIPTAMLQGTAANPLVLAFAPILIPCLDVIRVFLFRIWHGRNPFLPDRNHIHHKLMAAGMNQWQAMVTIVTAALLLTTINNMLSYYLNPTLIFGADITLWVLACVVLSLESEN